MGGVFFLENKSFFFVLMFLIFSCTFPTNNQNKANEGFVNLANIKSLPQLMQSTEYTIDEVSGHTPSRDGQTFQINNQAKDIGIRGWAIDKYTEEKAGGVFIKMKDQLYRANYRQERKDVATVFNNPAYTLCGFSCSIPLSNIAKGTYSIEILVLKNDQTSVFSPQKEKKITIEIN